MIKLINCPAIPEHSQKLKKISCEKTVKKIQVRGKNLLLDVNSLALYSVENEEIYNNLDVNSFGTDEMPFFPLWKSTKNKNYLCFQTTYACNLCCKYCFVQAHYADQSNSIDLKTCLDAVDEYQPNGRFQGYNVGFFGGEPLLNWEVIFQLTEELQNRIEDQKKINGEWNKKNAQKRNINYRNSFHITTNGTLITEPIADFCAMHGFSFIVSIDGDEKTHNDARPYKNSASNSFKDTLRGLSFLKEAYIRHKKNNPTTLRSTFDKGGVNLVQRLEYLNNLMYTGYGSHVSIEPSSLGEGCANETFEKQTAEELRAQFQEEYWKAADWFLKEIQEGRKPSFHHFEMPWQRLYDRDMAVSECGASKGYLSIGPKGKICACHREHESEIGDLYDGGINPLKQREWEDNRIYARKNCMDCYQRYLCGGGCRCNSKLLGKDISLPSWVECVFWDIRNQPVFWLMTQLTDKQKRLYSKYHGYKQGHAQNRIPRTKDGPIQQIIQRKNEGPQKSKPPCGLKFCFDAQYCPFSSCGQQDPKHAEYINAQIDAGKTPQMIQNCYKEWLDGTKIKQIHESPLQKKVAQGIVQILQEPEIKITKIPLDYLTVPVPEKFQKFAQTSGKNTCTCDNNNCEK